MDPSDDSDDDRDDVHDTISKLKVNSDHLNKSLNGYYRYIVKEVATVNNPVPVNFCCGISEPTADEVIYMKHIIYGSNDNDTEALKIAAADRSISPCVLISTFNTIQSYFTFNTIL